MEGSSQLARQEDWEINDRIDMGSMVWRYTARVHIHTLEFLGKGFVMIFLHDDQVSERGFTRYAWNLDFMELCL
jgi:hypothetical protein